MRSRIFCFFFIVLATSAFAQNDDNLFGPGEAKRVKRGFILNGNGGFDMPGADMAKRFGASYRIGPAVLYKTSSNWMFGAKFDFIVGSKIREDSLMINIRDKYSQTSGGLYEFISSGGLRIGVPVYERGWAVGVQAGKIIAFSKKHPDNGLMLLTTIGIMQHKLNIYDKDKAVYQLKGDYRKGYDRLTNGMFVEEYIGYAYFSDSRLINFTLGIDALFGFTKGRRTYQYDLMRAETKDRLDILFGLRAGWYIPMFKRKSEELSFE